MMQIPYQCLETSGNFLIAARGFTLDTFNLSNGSKISSFACSRHSEGPEASITQKSGQNDKDHQQVTESSSVDNTLGQSPPAKRRKLSDAMAEEPPKSNGKTNGKGKRDKRGTSLPNQAESLTIIALTSTKDGSHVIAVTGEDKTIRVFKHDKKGNLQQLSQRNMPKRPSAIALTSDDNTIISADKFGDVYSLPLLIPETAKESEDNYMTSKSSTPAPEEKPKQFVPAATLSTIHTLRNRRALEFQMQHKQEPKASERTFEHTLLLGHVSMLTDIALVERGNRSYIVTADRDEHIRVSRGIPQTHVIENFCLGHTEFVNRLCFPESHPDILISGGGDDDLFVWKWLDGQVVQKVDLRDHVGKVISELDIHQAKEHGEETNEPFKIAVSAIKYLKTGDSSSNDTIIVACEGIPALFCFSLSGDGRLSYHETIKLDGNPLGLVAEGLSGRFILSIDSVHEPGSKDQLRSSKDPDLQLLRLYETDGSRWAPTSLKFNIEATGSLNESAEDSTQPKGLSGILYTIENMRKRGEEE